MKNVAWLCSADMLPDHPSARGDRFELDLMRAALEPACAARGLDLRLRVWDDPELQAAPLDAVLIGPTWDYAGRLEDFLDRLGRIAARAPLFNPLPLVRWNARKGYLAELQARGLPGIPTLALPDAEEASLQRAFAVLGAEELVVKPLVGAGAARQIRLRRGAPLPPAEQRPAGPALAQPYLRAIEDEGELSFLFIGDRFSHALRKRPAPGDYRVQSLYGGREEPLRPSAEDLAQARAVLAAIPGPEAPLYARVDLVRGPDGRLLLMELELIEPYLYPEQGPELGPLLAEALAARIEAASRPARPR